jgi:hypothetical protein
VNARRLLGQSVLVVAAIAVLGALLQACASAESVRTERDAPSSESDTEPDFSALGIVDAHGARGVIATPHGTSARVSTRAAPRVVIFADVDHATWSRAAWHLARGETPPAAAVRSEDFVNARSYGYSRPRAGMPFAVETGLFVAPHRAASHLLRVGVRARDVLAAEAPAHLVVVLDTSRTMGGGRLNRAKSAIAHLVRALSPRDLVSVIAFDAHAQVVVAGARGDEIDAVEHAVSALAPSGLAHLEDGLVVAARVLDERRGPHLPHVLVVSPGHIDVGVEDAASLVARVAPALGQGALSALGPGIGEARETGVLRDDRLDALARHGRGQHHFIGDLNDVEAFVRTFTAALRPVARDVRVEVTFDGAQVEHYRLLGYESRPGAGGSPLGSDLGAGAEWTALFELDLATGVHETDASAACLARVAVRAADVADVAASHLCVDAASSTLAPRGARQALAAALFAEALRKRPPTSAAELTTIGALIAGDRSAAAAELALRIEQARALDESVRAAVPEVRARGSK